MRRAGGVLLDQAMMLNDEARSASEQPQLSLEQMYDDILDCPFRRRGRAFHGVSPNDPFPGSEAERSTVGTGHDWR